MDEDSNPAEDPRRVGLPMPDKQAIEASRRAPAIDPTLAVLERISRQLNSVQNMMIFFVILTLLSILVGGIIWLVAADSSSSSY